MILDSKTLDDSTINQYYSQKKSGKTHRISRITISLTVKGI